MMVMSAGLEVMVCRGYTSRCMVRIEGCLTMMMMIRVRSEEDPEARVPMRRGMFMVTSVGE